MICAYFVANENGDETDGLEPCGDCPACDHAIEEQHARQLEEYYAGESPNLQLDYERAWEMKRGRR